MKILSVVGARPNLVKIAPILRALEQPESANGRHDATIDSVLVHTGQHYDDNLSANFFADLRIRAPDHELAVGSGSHAAMTAEVMRQFEPVVRKERPDVVLVVGDVNSTMACALCAATLQVRVAHVEAGLRSFDRSMPEEVNRLVTDTLSDFLFTSEESADENLRREGHAPQSIFFVGNVMIDSLLWSRPQAQRSTILDRLGLRNAFPHPNPLPGAAEGADAFALLTVHRSGNVDDETRLRSILHAAAELARDLPVILPAHPRTRARISELGLTRYVQAEDAGGSRSAAGRVRMIEPLGYFDCVHLIANAQLVLTDSGGLQEETTYLGVPCLTLRDNTERPITITAGTSTLVGSDPERIVSCARVALQHRERAERRPPLWDGRAAERIVQILAERL
jgi:UDP-N-acetylglucosamine 2-epimerase (non-hydrolysing)